MHLLVNRTRPFTHKQGHFVINPSFTGISSAAGLTFSGPGLFSTFTATRLEIFSAVQTTLFKIGFGVTVTSTAFLPQVESDAEHILQNRAQAMQTVTLTRMVSTVISSSWLAAYFLVVDYVAFMDADQYGLAGLIACRILLGMGEGVFASIVGYSYMSGRA